MATQRAESLKNDLYPFFEEAEIETNCVPENWNGLVEALRNADYPELEKAQAIAESDLSAEQKEKKLKKLPHSIYKELNCNFFKDYQKEIIQEEE